MSPTRREPNFVSFIVTGALLGALAAVAVLLMAPAAESRFTFGDAVGYFAILGGFLGAVAGGAVAALLARRR